MEFRASLDVTTKVITAVVLLILVAIGMLVFSYSQYSLLVKMLLGFGLPGLIIGVCYAFRPVAYTVTESLIIIKRPAGNVTIPAETVRDVYRASKDSMGWMLRTFGNGGLFGYYGHFRSSNLGNLVLYATRRDRYVILELNDRRKIVLTPDDPGMVGEIKRRIGGRH